MNVSTSSAAILAEYNCSMASYMVVTSSPMYALRAAASRMNSRGMCVHNAAPTNLAIRSFRNPIRFTELGRGRRLAMHNAQRPKVGAAVRTANYMATDILGRVPWVGRRLPEAGTYRCRG